MSLGALPLRFEELPSDASFVVRTNGMAVTFTEDGPSVAVPNGEIQLSVVGGRRVRPEAHGLQQTRTNYFLGRDPSRWRSNVASYDAVTYAEVLPGVDLVFHGEAGQLEYDLVVAPGVPAEQLVMNVAGAAAVRVDSAGALRIAVGESEIVQRVPRVYQVGADGRAEWVAASYRITPERAVAFALADYDTNRPLIIDPILTYSTYVGGSNHDQINGIAVDTEGQLYVGGYTSSFGLGTSGAFIATKPGAGNTPFVAKLRADGSAFVFVSYVGGGGFEIGSDVAVDADGNVYFTGETNSQSFPVWSAAQATPGSGINQSDAFVTKLSADGATLVYSTYLGGPSGESGRSIAVDPAGCAHVHGTVRGGGFPTSHAIQTAYGGGDQDGFITKLSADGSQLLYSTYLGGDGFELTWDVATDAAGNSYAVGETQSYDFPIANAYDPSADLMNAYLTKLNGATGEAEYSTFLTSGSASGVIVDDDENVYVLLGVLGLDLPTTAGAYRGAPYGGWDFGVVKLNSDASQVLLGTYLGGTARDSASEIRLAPNGDIVVSGYVESLDYPVVGAAQGAHATGEAGNLDAVVSRLSPDGSTLLFSTYIGGGKHELLHGLAVDEERVYIAGITQSNNYPTTPSAVPGFRGGLGDAFVAVFGPTLALGLSATTVPPRGSLVLSGHDGQPPYGFSIESNASGPLARITDQGIFTAGAVGDTVDVIAVTDNLGTTLTAEVHVSAGVTVEPVAGDVLPLGSLQLSATGGDGGPYTWSVVTSFSGEASVTPDGLYSAGVVYLVTDVVRATDSLGNTGEASVAVGGSLVVTPLEPNVAPGATVTFVTNAGSRPVQMVLSVDGSGAAIEPGQLRYTAGERGDTTDVVTFSDELGHAVAIAVNVGPAPTENPEAPAVEPSDPETAPPGDSDSQATIPADGDPMAASPVADASSCAATSGCLAPLVIALAALGRAARRRVSGR